MKIKIRMHELDALRAITPILGLFKGCGKKGNKTAESVAKLVESNGKEVAKTVADVRWFLFDLIAAAEQEISANLSVSFEVKEEK